MLTPSADAVRAWLVARISEELGLDPRELDPREPLASYGLSSRQAVSLSGDLEEWLGRRLAPTLAYEHPTIEALARHLSGGEPEKAAAADADRRYEVNGARDGLAEPVAIIGIGCRLPGGADDPEALWRLLRDGVDAVTEVPAERWDADALYDPDPATRGKMTTRWGGFLAGVDRFDAAFFGISPREADRMDPQQRLLLEVAWEALEDGGQPAERLAGSQGGVFVGVSSYDYALRQGQQGPGGADAYAATGSANSVLAGRLSYLLDLRGPSVAVDSACSSSLVALHLACRSLRAGECDLALAGGVNLMLSPLTTISFSKFGMLARDGRCKSFDARADGYVRGEGCAVVVLKRLATALVDGDAVWALVRGTAVNQDGRSAGLTAPNRLSQEAVIRRALEDAGVPPTQVAYVEAHATGTPLGDPIEIEALRSVYGGSGRAPCAVGSVKTNIGHLEAAAGVAGLVKAILALRHGAIPPHLHLTSLNPSIDLDGSGLVIPTALQPWPRRDGRRRCAGVSSFGFSGTNAHAVLEEAPPEEAPVAEAPLESAGEELLALSARSPAALAALAAAHAERLRDAGPTLREVCYTAGARRSHHGHRLAVVGGSRGEMASLLDSYARGEARQGLEGGEAERGGVGGVAWVFAGQGSQRPGMGRELWRREAVFREVMERCDEAIGRLAGWSLLAELERDGGEGRLGRTAVAQPAIFAVEVALAALWRSWGVEPSAVVGHSVGEVAAAQVAGVLSLEEAVAVVCHRGRLMERGAGRGEMAVVGLEAAVVAAAVAAYGGRLSLAADNAPGSAVVSGEAAALLELVERLRAEGTSCRQLGVGYGFHSAQMRGVAAELEAALAGLAPRSGTVAVYSTVTGSAQGGEAFDAGYWGRGVDGPVRFREAVEGALAAGCGLFVEVSAQPVLVRSIAECAAGVGAGATVLASLRRGRGERRSLLESLGALYALGHEVDWRGLHPGGGRPVRLPSYPWQRERFWIEEGDGGRPAAPVPSPPEADGERLPPLLGRRLRSPLFDDVVFETALGIAHFPYLGDHRLAGRVVVPATAFLGMALAAAEAAGAGPCALRDVVFAEPLILGSGGRTAQIVLGPEDAGRRSFRVFSLDAEGAAAGPWRRHVSGALQVGDAAPASEPVSPAEFRTRCAEELPVAEHYRRLREHGLDYGPAFRGIAELWRGDGEALGRIALPAELAAEVRRAPLHPALLDGCLQVMMATLSDGGEGAAGGGDLYLPLAVESFRLLRPAGTELWSRALLRPADARGGAPIADFVLFDAAGRRVAELTGFRLRQAPPEALLRTAAAAPDEWLYEVEWRPRERAAPAAPAAAGRWLILADRSGVGSALAAALAQRGGEALTVFAAGAGGEPQLAPTRPEDFRDLVARTASDAERPWRGVVHLWSLDAPAAAGMTSAVLEEAQALVCGSALHLVQALAAAALPLRPRLWLVTQGAQPAGPAGPLAVAQAPLWGLARVIALEHPELRCVSVDLDPRAAADGHRDLAAEILEGAGGEDRVAFRAGRRYAARLVRSTPPAGGDGRREEPAPVRLEIPEPGILDNIELQPARRRRPGPGEVEIRVRAAGLNFRDVLNALGLYPGDAVPLGGECAGEIVALGEGVRDLEVGAAVVAVAPASFATFATTAAALVAALPPELSPEDAATIPIAFLTAHHALHGLADLCAGERVLIHAATGGVGLAAVRLAQRCGAVVFGTAGSAEKRAFLRSQGVEHALDSRSLDFAAGVMERTDGGGVDVVLNSLGGEFIAKSLSALAPGGRFLELGKGGIWEPEKVAAVRADVDYRIVDLAALCRAEPAAVGALLAELVADCAAGGLEPLPRRVFPVAEAAGAFRHMAQARHIGKIVLSFEGPPSPPQPAAEPAAVRADATYLITGGLGALGLAAARCLAARGARHLVLAGRSAPEAAAVRAVEEVRRQGAAVKIARADVGRESEVAALLDDIDGSMPPLGGVLHAAGILDDGALLRQSWERFARVLAPKVAGAWTLHALTADRPLDFFVLFSSAAAILGSPGQGNYAAASAFLDALAHHRRALGAAAVSIAWGPWAGGGMAADGRGSRGWRDAGLELIAPEAGLQLLGRLLRWPAPHVAAMPVDWAQLARWSGGAGSSFVSALALSTVPGAAAAAPERRGLILARIEAAPVGERRRLLLAHLCDQVARVLGLDPAQPLDPRHGLFDLGMDSLMAVELKNRLETSLDCTISPTVAFDYPTLEALASHLAVEVLGLEPTGGDDGRPAADADAEADAGLLEEVGRLSESELEASIDEELERLDGAGSA